jgi:hypothetical protein
MGWSVPKIWNGGDVWILGGGPSIVSQFKIPPDIVRGVMEKRLPMSAYSPYFKSIHDKHVIGINVAYKIGNWIDMVFFGDGKWFVKEKEELEQFPNLKVGSTSQCIKYLWCKYISRDNSKLGISSDSGKVCFNYNSGASAISIAANAGAKRIFLLGFDMQYVSGERHFHREYSNGKPANLKKARRSFSLHLKGFPKIKEDADKRGIEIYNVCPNSAITCLPKITLEEALKMVESPIKENAEENKHVVSVNEYEKEEVNETNMLNNQKILCFVNHYYNPNQEKGFKGGSTVNTDKRQKAVLTAIEQLKKLPNCEVKICGLKGFTVQGIEVDIDFTGIKPWNLVYESLNYMHNFVNDYDYFINIEDDILLKSDVINNVIEFDKLHKINEVFLPNRIEIDGQQCRFVDLGSGWKKDSPMLQFKNHLLKVANNFHSAILMLRTDKYKYAYNLLDSNFREIWWGGPMASAYAYFHIPFQLYRNSQLTKFHVVEHLDHWKCYDQDNKDYLQIGKEKFVKAQKIINNVLGIEQQTIEVKIPYGLNMDLAGAYNKAVESSNADWVLLLDHDIFLSCNPHWFDMCMQAIGSVNHKVGLITCVSNPRHNKNKGSQWADITVNSPNIEDHVQAAYDLYKRHGMTLRRVNTHKVAGFFMLVKKKIWERIKFRSVGKGVDLIDWDYCERLLKYGYQIYEMPGLYVYHKRDVRKLNWGSPLLKEVNKKELPKTFSEWIHYYMKEPYDNYNYGLFIDKHKVKEFVNDVVNVAKEFAYFTKPEQIDEFDYSKLPASFVIKATHGSHMNIIVRDGISLQSANQKKAKTFDLKEAKTKMKEWLSKRFAESGELYYDQVERGVLIEENLCNYFTDYEKQNGIVDYKAWCIHGKIELIATANSTGTKVNYYDCNWNELPLRRDDRCEIVAFPKPVNLVEMVDTFHKLCDKAGNPPFVRVDLYNFGNKTFFGEFTHSPGKGDKVFLPRNEKEPKDKYELKLGKAMLNNALTIVCFKWNHTVGTPLPAVERGIEYNAEYVNKLYRSIERNYTLPHNFICVTDDPKGIECDTYPLWDWGREYGRCFTRLKMFDPAMRQVFGKRVICIDLDTVITGNLNKIFSHKEDFIIHTYYPDSHNYQQKYNGSLFMMDIGSRPEVYTKFTGWKSIEAVKKAQNEKKVLGSDQGWINYILGNNEARFGEEDGIYHLRNIMRPNKSTGRVSGQLPDNACMVMFSGNQDPSMPMYVNKLDWVKKNWVL